MQKQKNTNLKIYKRILQYCKPYRQRLFVGILAGILTGGSIFGVLYQLQNFLKPLTGETKTQVSKEQIIFVKKEGVTHKLIASNVTSESSQENYTLSKKDKILKVQTISNEKKILAEIPKGFKKVLTWLGVDINKLKSNPNAFLMIISGAFFIFFMSLKSLFTFANQYYMTWVGSKAITDIREELFNKISMQSMKFYEERKVGDMMASIYTETQIIQNSISATIPGLIRNPIEVLSVLVYIIFIIITHKAYYLFIILLVGGVISVVCANALAKRVKEISNASLGNISFITTRILETLSCIRLVKAYNMEKKEQKLFQESNNSFFKIMMKMIRSVLATGPLMELMSLIIAIILIIYCVLNGFGLSSIISLAVAVQFAYRPVKQLARLNSDIQFPLAAAQRVFDVLDMPNENIEDKEKIEKKNFSQAITFKKVAFSYNSKPFMQDINISINKGEYVAFVGEAGSGKSTLVKLLTRFYDVTGGVIKIDGIDIRQMSLASLRGLIGFIDQTTLLFNEDINYNISYGVEGVSQEEIIQASKKAHAHKFISQKPEGYNYRVGEKGEHLSGGQRQRIAIARAIVKNAQILVLDEATSALDNITEKEVQKALDQLMQGRTTIAIAHRLSTIKNADCIYAMKDGKIIEQGTHNQLLKQKGYYTSMWNTQFEEKIF